MTESSIAILGPGLLGGSILHDAKRLGCPDVRAYARRPEVVAEIESLQLAHVAGNDLARVVDGVDFIVLASPVGAYPALAETIVGLPLKKTAVVTDVGSVKGMVMETAGKIFRAAGVSFVGSHPMAGSEAKGLKAAKPNLFQQAACILTPDAETPAEDVLRVRAFWESLGSRVFEMDAHQHDRVVARISHMPHLAAAAVILAALESSPEIAKFAAGGLRDTTRVASGDPEMWREILMENRQAVLQSGRELHQKLGEMLEFLEKMEDEQLRDTLEAAKSLRDSRYAAE